MRITDALVAAAFVAAALLISTKIKAQQQQFDPTQSGQAARLQQVADADPQHSYTLETQKAAGVPQPN